MTVPSDDWDERPNAEDWRELLEFGAMVDEQDAVRERAAQEDPGRPTG